MSFLSTQEGLLPRNNKRERTLKATASQIRKEIPFRKKRSERKRYEDY